MTVLDRIKSFSDRLTDTDRKIIGTRMDSSYILNGQVPLPFPQTPWCPAFQPWSAVKTTRVFSRHPRCSRYRKTRPILRSAPEMSAK